MMMDTTHPIIDPLRDDEGTSHFVPAGLDVERLAQAFWNVTERRMSALPPSERWLWPAWSSPEADTFREKAIADAAEVAAEYSRLTTDTGDPS